MKTVIAGINDQGRRIDVFLKKLMPSASYGLIYRYIRTNKVKVNKKRPKENYRLAQGDEIRIFGDDSLFAEKNFSVTDFALDIIYEDSNILIANKPPGIACHSDKNHKDNTFIDYIKSYLIKKGEYSPDFENTFVPALCNRIDVNTSGLVIAAKNLNTLRIINEKIKNREIRRFYLCKTIAAPAEKSGIIKTQIKKDAGNISHTVNEGGKSAETHYKVLSRNGGEYIIESEIITGRSHQIRVHLSSIGAPIVGDTKYGGGKGGQKLVSYKVSFDFKSDAKELNYLNGKTFEIKNCFN